jgi:hypothetical protein
MFRYIVPKLLTHRPAYVEDTNKGEMSKLLTLDILIPLLVSNMIENVLNGAPEKPSPRAFTYAS